MGNRRPPRAVEWLLGRILDPRDRDMVLGDLHEEYERVRESASRQAARRWYVRQALGAVRPSFRRRLSAEPVARPGARRGGGIAAAMDGLWRDVGLAGRGLWGRPGYTLVAGLTLAVAIGANAATFGVIDAVLLRPLSYPEAARIVSLSETHAERMPEAAWVSIPNVRDWRAHSASFETIALFRAGSMAVTGDGDPAYVVGMRSGRGFFEVFGTAALLGRVTASGEEAAGVVVLSHGLWMRRYGGSRSVVGRTLVLDGALRTIIGVMPPGYNAAGDWIGAPVDVWVPFDFEAGDDGRGDRSFNAAGRLRPGVGVSDAAAELALIGARLSEEYPEANAGWTIGLTPWKELITGDTRRTLHLVWAAMGLVLLVACANVGNLVLNRALARESDVAVRTALGARTSRLVRGTLAESVLVSLVGAALGLPLAVVLVSAARSLDPGDLPRLATATVDLRVVAFTATVALAVGVVLGLYPAWRAAHASLHDALRSTRSGVSRKARRVRDGMAVVQLAVAVSLLAGSALAVRGFLRLGAVPPGFEPRDVVTATVVLSWNRVSELPDRVAFTRSVIDNLRALPGVESAAMINSLPFSGSSMQQTFTVAGRPSPDGDEPFAGIRGISPDYARTMRIPVRGRELREADLAGQPAAVLVNEALARRYFPDRDPLGERLTMFGGDVEAEIVGIMGDVHHFALDSPPVAEIYVPYTADFLSSKTFLVRSARDAASLGDDIRNAVYAVDPAQPLRAAGPDRAEVVRLETMVDASLAGRRFRTLLLALLAGLAVLLSAIGLSSVIAITVTERSKEIGLRMALGAARGTVLRWILRRSARLALFGLGAGLLLVLAGGGALGALLFDVSARDPRTLVLAVVAFALVTVPAILAPAIRATRVDSGRVLRED